MDVGHELRQARERRAMSLQQLSRITKISPHVLQIVEASDECRLPARVFTRAFVRSYAVEVGLDPDATVERYFGQFQANAAMPVEIDRPPGELPAAASDAETPRSSVRMLQGRFGTTAVLTLVGVTIVALAMQTRGTSETDAGASKKRTATAGLAPAPPSSLQPVGTSGSTPPPVDPLRIEIVPTGPCWVQAAIGDAKVLGGMLNAGDRRAFEAPSEVTLRVGDPATFAFTINGRPGRIAGAPAQAVTVRITRENYTQFLSR